MKVRTITGSFGHERMIIKHVVDAHGWINKRYDNEWAVYDGPLTLGTYAKVAGTWVNVKKLDPSVLVHV